MKYLVMEHHLGYSIVVDETGDFIRVMNVGYDIGETITEVTPVRRQKAAILSKPLMLTFGTVAAVFIFAIVAVFSGMFTAFAEVTLRINPEVKIEVDKRNTVQSIRAVNRDGSILIDGYNFEDKKMLPVIDELLDRAMDKGFLHEGGTIAVDLDSRNMAWLEVSSLDVRSHLEDFMSNKLEVTIQVSRLDTGEHQVVIPFGGDTRPSVTKGEEDMTDYGVNDVTDPAVTDGNETAPRTTRGPKPDPGRTVPPQPAPLTPTAQPTWTPYPIGDDDSLYDDVYDDSLYDDDFYDDSLYDD